MTSDSNNFRRWFNTLSQNLNTLPAQQNMEINNDDNNAQTQNMRRNEPPHKRRYKRRTNNKESGEHRNDELAVNLPSHNHAHRPRIVNMGTRMSILQPHHHVRGVKKQHKHRKEKLGKQAATNNDIVEFVQEKIDLYCPITKELMTNPVIGKCNHRFQKSSIEAMLRRNSRVVCPVVGCKALIVKKELKPDVKFAEEVKKRCNETRVVKLIDLENDSESSVSLSTPLLTVPIVTTNNPEVIVIDDDDDKGTPVHPIQMPEIADGTISHTYVIPVSKLSGLKRDFAYEETVTLDGCEYTLLIYPFGKKTSSRKNNVMVWYKCNSPEKVKSWSVKLINNNTDNDVVKPKSTNGGLLTKKFELEGDHILNPDYGFVNQQCLYFQVTFYLR